MKIVEEAILSTDLALYFRKKDLFLETANKGEIDWQGDKKDREWHPWKGIWLGPLSLVSKSEISFQCSLVRYADDSLRRQRYCQAVGDPT